MCTKNYDQIMYGSWNMVHDGQTDGWTYGHIDRQKKWHIEVGALPKNWKKKSLTIRLIFCFILKPKITVFYLLSFVFSCCTTCWHSLSLIVTRCHLLWSVVPLIVIRCHLLSFDVPLICLFINDLHGEGKYELSKTTLDVQNNSWIKTRSDQLIKLLNIVRKINNIFQAMRFNHIMIFFKLTD